MKYQLAVVLASACVQSFAQVPASLAKSMIEIAEHHHRFPFHECAKLKLEEGQKTELKAAVQQFRRERQPLRGGLKDAIEAYRKVLGDPKSDRTAADQAAAKVNAAEGELAVSRHTFLNNIFYNVLKPEQREAGAECLGHLGHHFHHGWHHSGGEGGHPALR